jgi:hypothetical protein
VDEKGIDCSGRHCKQAFRAIGLGLAASDCVPRPRNHSWLRVDGTKGTQLRAAGRMLYSIYPSITSAGSGILGVTSRIGSHVEVWKRVYIVRRRAAEGKGARDQIGIMTQRRFVELWRQLARMRLVLVIIAGLLTTS